MFYSLKLRAAKSQTSGDLFFNGSYEMDTDHSVDNAERIRMTAAEIWKVTGYRFM